MSEAFAKWDVTRHLRTREDACLYLEACAEEDPGDGSLIPRCSERYRSGGQREPVGSRRGNEPRRPLQGSVGKWEDPSFATVVRVTRALGLQVRITA